MARLNDIQRAALANWWTLAETEAFTGTTATDTIIIASAMAQQAGRSLAFAENAAIGVLYGYARRMANATSALGGATDESVIDASMIAIPPWARDEQVMNTTPIWHVTFSLTGENQAGEVTTQYVTSVFEMTLPETAGELAADIQDDAQSFADKYRIKLMSAVPHMILAV